METKDRLGAKELKKFIAELHEERHELDIVIGFCEYLADRRASERSPGPVPMSAATKAKIRKAMKARWAAKKKQK